MFWERVPFSFFARCAFLCAVFLFLPLFASAGSQTYTTPGTYTFTVPSYDSLTVQAWGGGGGGGSYCTFGNAGGYSAFGNIIGYGGAGATYAGNGCAGIGGAGGTASGGTTNASGNVGSNQSDGTGGAGGSSPSGGSGGVGSKYANGTAGSAPGGGGGGTYYGGGGGGGGYSSQTYASGGLTPGSYTVVVGSGGSSVSFQGERFSGDGAPGQVSISWTDAAPTVTLNANGYDNLQIAPGGSYTLNWNSTNSTSCTISYTYSGGSGSFPVTPNQAGSGGSGLVGSYTITCTGSGGSATKTVTIVNISCSVTADQNPIAYGGSTTLRWSSANASTFYMNNVGYVTPNQSGSAGVGPLSSTNYGGTATGNGGSVSCPFTLNVNPPANCTTPWGTTVNHGSSVTAYQAATVPYGQSCVSQTRTCNNGTLSGSYAYSTCSVNPAPPLCSLSVNPTSVTQGQSSTLTWSSTNTTSCTGNNFSTGGATSGSTSVSPSSSTTYTASCTGAGGTAQCTGSGAGGIGAIVTVSCTPVYTCTGAGNQTIAYTDASCNQSTITTCVLPEFCAPGSAVCLYNAITGNISASPRLVPSGKTTTIAWTTANAVSCTVSGNGDTWTGTSGSHVSSPITQLTFYTLVCDDADADTVQDDFTDKVNVVRVPSWFEI